MKRAIVLALALAGCASQPTDDNDKLDTSSVEQDSTVCGVGPTVKGIDVSVYQGTINWTSVANAGVQFAFIRVGDGMGTDSKFAANWAGAKAAGVYRGAYQFFRPEDDAVSQANLLLSKMGTLGANDLPPVLDVEVADSVSAANIAARVKTWMNTVQAATGRTPIIYTGKYFWEDNVGNAAVPDGAPLWHAQYTSATCPNIANAWSNWAIWQYSDSGTIAGISGGVDVDRFNGDINALKAFINPQPCGVIGAAGGIIDNSDECFEGGGPAAYLRAVDGHGYNSDLLWTHTTSSATEANFATWTLDFNAAGAYQIEVYTDTSYAQSTKAKYIVTASGAKHNVVINQKSVNGWQSLGAFNFTAGGAQSVHLGDNTGEAGSTNTQLVFDAVRITPASPDAVGSNRADEGDPVDPADPSSSEGGCNAGGAAGGATMLLVGIVGLALSTRRKRAA
ncbi:MAG TPA: GH25 family lysozyme [Kofleriaceae bacterium]